MSVKFEEKRKREPIVVEPESFGEKESIFESGLGTSGVFISSYSGEVRFEHPKSWRPESVLKDWKWGQMLGWVGGAVWKPIERWARVIVEPPDRAGQAMPPPQVRSPAHGPPAGSPPQSAPAQSQTVTPAMVKSVRLVSPPQFGSETRQVTYYVGPDYGYIQSSPVQYTVVVELDKPATGSEYVDVFVEAEETTGWHRSMDWKSVTPQAGATTVTVSGTILLEHTSDPVTYTIQAMARTVAPTTQNTFIYSGKAQVTLQPQPTPQPQPPSQPPEYLPPEAQAPQAPSKSAPGAGGRPAMSA